MKKKEFFILSFVLLIATFFVVFRNIKPSTVDFDESNFSVHYVDVGQGDAELIFCPDGEVMLIDAGPNDSSRDLLAYIRSKNVSKIDYLVLTHPHEDHIGGACAVLDNFTVSNVYMPKLPDNMIPTTKTYENTLQALIDHNVNVIDGKAGIDIKNTSEFNAQIIAPNGNTYENLNNYSIVLKVNCKGKTFLFMGDAEYASENEMRAKFDLKADVLKCGHHGSSTSTNQKFLQSVAPKCVVISCGENNKYGHPHKQTLNKLTKLGADVYRTDLNGTITISVEEGNLKIRTEK